MAEIKDMSDAELQALVDGDTSSDSLVDTAAGALRSFGGGGLLGFRDEAQAGLESLIGIGDINSNLNRIRAEDAQFADDHPVIDTVAGAAGGLIYGGGSTLPAKVAIQGALGAVEGFGRSDDKLSTDALVNTVVGGGLGAGTTYGLGKLGRPDRVVPETMSDRVSTSISAATERAEARAGKRLITRAQEFGSPTARGFEAASETVPFLSATNKTRDSFTDNLNLESIRGIGIPENKILSGHKLTDDVLQEASELQSEAFDAIFNGVNIKVPKNINRNIGKIVTENTDVIGKNSKFGKRAEEVIGRIRKSSAKGNIPATELQQLRSEVLDLARGAGSKKKLARSFNKLAGELDTAIEEGLPPGKVDAWRKVNGQFKNLNALEASDNIITGQGDVRGKALLKSLSKQSGKRRNIPVTPLSDLARMSNRIPDIGNSGTATRSLISNVMAAPAAGAAILEPSTVAAGAGIRLLGETAQRDPSALIRGSGSLLRALDTNVDDLSL